MSLSRTPSAIMQTGHSVIALSLIIPLSAEETSTPATRLSDSLGRGYPVLSRRLTCERPDHCTPPESGINYRVRTRDKAIRKIVDFAWKCIPRYLKWENI